ncbi:MAG: cache domain-containing protein [Proteobacteria bacterium]|nr:cache domain-containing protein [Pseudomonadota bacterium]
MIRFLGNQGIRFKILAGYTSIFVAASLLGGMIIYSQVKKTITQNIQNELNNTTGVVLNMVKTAANVSIKNYLRAVCEKTKENIEDIYQRYASGQITEDSAKNEVRKIIFSQTIGKTGYIYCVDSNGIPVEHPNPAVAGKSDWAQLSFVREMIKRKQGYLEYDWKNPGEDQYRPKALYMNYFKPWDWIISVSTYSEELKELINVTDFKESILALKFGKTGYSYIIDSKGNVIIHPKLTGNFFDARDGDGNYFIQKITRLKTGRLIYSWKNSDEKNFRKKIVIFNYIPEYDWIVASSGYFDEFYSILKLVKEIVIVGVFIMLFLVLLTSFWLSALIIQPLKVLMNHFAKGASEDLSTRMPVKSSDEIGKLSIYFNSFMEKLETYNASLKDEISGHRLTAEALRNSEWKYRSILRCIDEGYFEVALNGDFTFFNPSMLKITGYSKEELSQKNIMELTDINTSNEFSKTFDKLEVPGKSGRIVEWELLKKDSSICFAETSLSAITDKKGDQSGFRGVLRDVTQRIQSQKALLLSEEMFSKAFHCSPSGMFLANIETGRLINVNESFLTFSGYDSAKVLGKNLMDLEFFRDKKQGLKLLRLLLKEKSLRHQEIEFCKTSGEIRQGVISAEVLEISGEPCILAALEDHTEANRLERQFLDMSERERQKIAFDLHDDLCPQLIGIEVLIELLRQRLSKELPDTAASADKIRLLIKESIRKTRLLSRGLCPVDIAHHGFGSSLSELVGYVEDVFGIVCHLDCDESNPFTDNAIATHAYYIAHEAVHNAIKHGDAKNISIHFSSQNKKSRLMIKDDGKGISQSDKGKGMGLKIMTYRAKRINALLEIKKCSQGGTMVLLEMEIT